MRAGASAVEAFRGRTGREERRGRASAACVVAAGERTAVHGLDVPSVPTQQRHLRSER